jgi:hypothetical protein
MTEVVYVLDQGAVPVEEYGRSHENAKYRNGGERLLMIFREGALNALNVALA